MGEEEEGKQGEVKYSVVKMRPNAAHINCFIRQKIPSDSSQGVPKTKTMKSICF